MLSVLLAGLSALCYGAADFSGGFASRRSPLVPVLVTSQLAGAVLALAFVLASGEAVPAGRDLAWGATAGVAGAAGLALLYRGIARGLVAIVSPTAALVGAAIPVAFGILSGERPSPAALAGAAVCLPAVLLLSWERGGAADRRALRSALGHALLSGAFIGLFFIALARSAPGSGLWPLLAARGASIAILVAAALVSRQRLAVARAAALPTLVAGLADMAANVLFLLATRAGLLSLAVIVASLYPAPTVLLARLFFRERIPPARAIGLALAVAGIALIGLR
ncbi:DMT family transporter [Anaeromyxobacter paludicola]|uniref:Multidrug transporter n=1 Tax=Anaeromyxobacter paludicola TaxID=2918171 RepID=A0ABM7X9A0_9BACT|nr:DMT family transporter [Anaeromyxobacter paludicola]BDG08426.1 multidrug transporter [Anaeromyxobacter paludicola]